MTNPLEGERRADPKTVAQTQMLLGAAAWKEERAGCHERLGDGALAGKLERREAIPSGDTPCFKAAGLMV